MDYADFFNLLHFIASKRIMEIHENENSLELKELIVKHESFCMNSDKNEIKDDGDATVKFSKQIGPIIDIRWQVLFDLTRISYILDKLKHEMKNLGLSGEDKILCNISLFTTLLYDCICILKKNWTDL